MINRRKALVLSSGGLDSTTTLAIAIDRLGKENVGSVSVFYGQKHDRELRRAKEVAEYYQVPHYELDLSAVMSHNKNCTLLKNNGDEIDHSSYADQIKSSENGMVSTYVPFRNGLMLSALASMALSIYPDAKVDLYIGIHKDDVAGAAYADCTLNFAYLMDLAIGQGTYGLVNVVAPLVTYTKAEIVKAGLKLEVPYNLTWSCYEGGDTPCGKCGTCIDRAKAFSLNGISDPAL